MPKAKKKTPEIHLNIKSLKNKDVALIFGIRTRTVYNWTKDGCPRNPDDSYDLISVVKWREGKTSEPSTSEEKYIAELQKINNQNKKLELEIKELEGETIPRQRFVEIQQRQATELMGYLTEGYKRNGQELYANIKKTRSVKAFLEVVDGFIKAAMDAFVKGGIDI